MTPAQCRAARGLLGWTQGRLADASRVHADTVRGFERDTKAPHRATLAVLERVLTEAGVDFVVEDGRVGVFLRLEGGGFPA